MTSRLPTGQLDFSETDLPQRRDVKNPKSYQSKRAPAKPFQLRSLADAVIGMNMSSHTSSLRAPRSDTALSMTNIFE